MTKITHFAKAAGCARKVAPGALSELAHVLKNEKDPNLIVDFFGNEDAGAFVLTPEIALLQTTDFITAVVDDPYVYGQVAAANAISDVYAMGGEVKTALNLLMWDACHISEEMVCEILEGGLSKIKEAGGVLLGGHTINDDEQKYGLAVSGVAHPSKIWRNNGARVGDILILTKPLGVGVMTTAIKQEKISEDGIKLISQQMSHLNKYACEIAKDFHIHGCTDVTGFGLFGHAFEMSGGNDGLVSLQFWGKDIPYIKEALMLGNQGVFPGGEANNTKYLEDKVEIKQSFKEYQTQNHLGDLQRLFFDPQTSGGLLFALQASEAQEFLKRLVDKGEKASIVGEVLERENKKPIILV